VARQHVFQRLAAERHSGADPYEGCPDAAQHEQVGDADRQQEQRRDHGPERAANRMHGAQASRNAVAVAAIAIAASSTMLEWPSEKKNPAVYGALPCRISLRTTLSMAAIWSVSSA
jgi:hypothetical protein